MLMTQNSGYQIEYQAYLPVLDLDQMISDCSTEQDLEASKSLILTYIFSLKKENRSLHKRLNDRVHRSLHQQT
jgi:tRNA A37 N6-isopentenylltransferase MiaA